MKLQTSKKVLWYVTISVLEYNIIHLIIAKSYDY